MVKKSIGSKTIVFPTPVFIIGTYCEDGRPNAMNVAWGGVCCSNPPSISISVRRQRCTYDNIMRTKAFTVNIPSREFVKEADYFGIVSGKKADKFQVTGLNAAKGDKVDAPYIEEFSLNIECKVVDFHEIGEGHIQFVGEIMDVKVNQDCLDADGTPDIVKVDPMIYDPSAKTYYAAGKMLEKAFSVGKEFLK